MNNRNQFLNTFWLLIISLSLIISFTLIQNNYILAKDYSVSIHGTSNIHDWVEKVVTVSGNGVVNRKSDGSFDIEAIQIIMEAHSIQSDKGNVMNNNTYKALKADAYPKITFKLTAPVKNIQTQISEKTINATGNLNIAGVTRSVTMGVKVNMKTPEKLTLEGSHSINMTDYGINPPKALFGTLQTGNKVTIKFKINLTVSSNKI